MISVIVPYDKDRGFLKQCVDSIESQSGDFEIVLSQSDESVSYNFNRGLEKCKGEYCKFVTEDDYLPEGALEYLAEGINGFPWIFANAIQIDPNGEWIYRPSDYSKEYLTFEENVKTNRVHGGTTLYRTEILKSIGGMNEELWTGEEYDMHLRLFSIGAMPGYINKEVYCHRLWSGQKSKLLRKNRKHERQEEIKRIQSLYYDKV
jgi:glycosyltransferase involved in cell wall biosynthesis